jgi:hypothetical protein
MMAAGAALLAGFGLQQRSRSRRGRDPLVELSLLRSRSYTAGLAVMQVFFAGISGLGAGHFHRALTRTLWLDAALLLASVLVSPLLPRRGVDAEAALLAAA